MNGLKTYAMDYKYKPAHDAFGDPIKVGDLAIVSRTSPHLVKVRKVVVKSGSFICDTIPHGWRIVVKRNLSHQMMKLENFNLLIDYHKSNS